MFKSLWDGIKNNSYIQPQYYRPFELQRVDVSMYGSFKNQNEQRIQMLIITYLIIKIFLRMTLLRIRKFIPGISNSENDHF